MKFAVTLVSLSLATAFANPLSLLGGNSQVHLNDELSVPGENPLDFCSSPADDILQIFSVDLTPNPPEAGKTLNIVASGNLTQKVEKGAKVHLQVKYGLITLINQQADLCDQVGNVDLECPLEKGPLKLSKDVDLPKEIPSGRYNVLADVFTDSGDKITCLTAAVQFHR